MGTRGLIGFIIASQRHGCYNHWDSYPSGLGAKLLSFILSISPNDYALIAQRLRDNFTWKEGEEESEEESEEEPVEKAVKEPVEKPVKKLKDGFQVLEAIRSGTPGKFPVHDEVVFLQDGLFCEWAYFLDFENQKMEVWQSGHFLISLVFDEIVAEGEEKIVNDIEID